MRALADDRWRVSVSPRRVRPARFSDRWLLGPKPPWPITLSGWIWTFLDPPLRLALFAAILTVKVWLGLLTFHAVVAADEAGYLGPRVPHVPQIAEMLGLD